MARSITVIPAKEPTMLEKESSSVLPRVNGPRRTVIKL